jgi:hypothetical protein
MAGGKYYTLGFQIDGNIDHSAYCTITPVPGLELAQGGFTYVASQADTSGVVIYPQVAQLQIPSSTLVTGAVLIITNSPEIAGQLLVSPAIGVPAVLTLYGNGGKPIGDIALEPGRTTVDFKWDVSQADAIPESDRAGALQRLLPQSKS